MARNRRSPRPAAPVTENSVLADWERELLGLPLLPGRTVKAQAARKRTPKTTLKAKTAEAAAHARQMARAHKKGKYTRDFKPRKSRRALKRELYPKKEG